MDRDGFERFLCQAPLFDPNDVTDEAESKNGSNRTLNRTNLDNPDEFRTLQDEGVWPKYKGGYHMLHRIDGKLIAIIVIDMTRNALTGMYCIYDPDFDFISPGTLCALLDIYYIKKIIKDYDSNFNYYYLGLYL